MKFPNLFVAGLTIIALLLVATPVATAQIVISNETLVSTTFVVNKQSAAAKCDQTGCGAKTPMFAPVPVTCPAANGQTCTFHISLDTKTSITFPCGGQDCFGSGPTAFYQFSVDGAAPTIGPTDANGNYVFEKNAFTTSSGSGVHLASRQSYTASVLATVTNSNSSSHKIIVSVGCSDTINAGGCEATAHWSTMRVDVFEP